MSEGQGSEREGSNLPAGAGLLIKQRVVWLLYQIGCLSLSAPSFPPSVPAGLISFPCPLFHPHLPWPYTFLLSFLHPESPVLPSLNPYHCPTAWDFFPLASGMMISCSFCLEMVPSFFIGLKLLGSDLFFPFSVFSVFCLE